MKQIKAGSTWGWVMAQVGVWVVVLELWLDISTEPGACECVGFLPNSGVKSVGGTRELHLQCRVGSLPLIAVSIRVQGP